MCDTIRTFDIAMESNLADVQNVVQRVLAACQSELAGAEDADALAAQIRLSLTECIVNIIKHAYHGEPGHPIGISTRVTSERMSFEIEDQGDEFIDVAQAIGSRKRAILDTTELPEGSMGLFLIHAEMDSVSYGRSRNRNRWVLEKHICPWMAGPEMALNCRG